MLMGAAMARGVPIAILGIGTNVLVSDRGMITDARIREELEPAGLDWITALRAPARKLAGGTR